MNARDEINLPQNQSDSPADYVDAAVAAQHFGVSKVLIYRLAREQRIPSKRIGHRAVRFRLADLEAHFDRPPVERPPRAGSSRRGPKVLAIPRIGPGSNAKRTKSAFVSMRSGPRQQMKAGAHSGAPPNSSRQSRD